MHRCDRCGEEVSQIVFELGSRGRGQMCISCDEAHLVRDAAIDRIAEQAAREMHAQRTIDELRGRLATEESERIRCRDGWAGASNERDAIAAKLAELDATAAQQLDEATALLEKARATLEWIAGEAQVVSSVLDIHGLNDESDRADEIMRRAQEPLR